MMWLVLGSVLVLSGSVLGALVLGAAMGRLLADEEQD
jgi:hypothetical protein